MKNNKIKTPNYNNYYNLYQMCLPLNLEYVLDEYDELFSFLKAIGGIDFSGYMKKNETRGRKGHDNFRMLKAILFAYMQHGKPSLRKMEDLCAHDVRYIWLTEEKKPNEMIKSFRYSLFFYSHEDTFLLRWERKRGKENE